MSPDSRRATPLRVGNAGEREGREGRAKKAAKKKEKSRAEIESQTRTSDFNLEFLRVLRISFAPFAFSSFRHGQRARHCPAAIDV
jgi:hypothetical protein